MNSLFKAITIPSQNAETVVPFKQEISEHQMIVINDLDVMMHIGVTAEERAMAQKVVFNFKAEINPAIHWRNDDMAGVVSYVDIIDTIENIATQYKDIKLLETLAEMILEECFGNPQIKNITLEINKPDIIKNVRSVGVEFYRER